VFLSFIPAYDLATVFSLRLIFFEVASKGRKSYKDLTGDD
jgi:hypothetical protein